MNTDSPNKKTSVGVAALRSLAFIISVSIYSLISALVTNAAAKNESIIAFSFPLLGAFTLPLGFFFFAMGWVIIGRLFNKKKDISDTAMLEQIAEKDKRISDRLLSIFLIIGLVISSVFMFFGVSKKTVITSDYAVRDYSITGELKGCYEPDELRFAEIYPKAEYRRRSGFERIYAVVELYINEDDCLYFTSDDFKNFDHIIGLKEALEEKGLKIYIRNEADNEPDPESDNLYEDEIKHIEEFYSKYNKLKQQ